MLARGEALKSIDDLTRDRESEKHIMPYEERLIIITFTDVSIPFVKFLKDKNIGVEGFADDEWVIRYNDIVPQDHKFYNHCEKEYQVSCAEAFLRVCEEYSIPAGYCI